MRKYLLIIVFGFVIISCDGEDSVSSINSAEIPLANNNPTAAVLLTPTDNQICIDNNLDFNWDVSTDADGDSINYDVEVATDKEFTKITHRFSNLEVNTKKILLDRNVIYFWRVKSKDNKGGETISSVFEFYTEGFGDENHLPFAPKVLSPEMGSTISSSIVSLVWGSTDVDGDDLTFDVYLDTNSSPTTLRVENHPEKNFTVSSLASGVTYFWKVIAKDGNGGVSQGQVWSFTTN